MNRIACAILLLAVACPAPGHGKPSSAAPAPTPDSLSLTAIAPPAIPETPAARAAAIAAIEARLETLWPSHRLPLLKQALAIAAVDGPSPATLELRVRIVAAMSVEGDPDAKADFTPSEQAVIEAARSALDDHRGIDWRPNPATARAITRLAQVLIDVGDFADADIVLTRAVAMHRALAHGAPSADYGSALAMMAELRAGKFGRKVRDVEPSLRAAIAQYRGLPQPDLATAHALEAKLAALYEEDPKREDDARALHGKLLADAQSGGSVRDRIEALSGLARFELRLKKPDAAIAALKEAIDLTATAMPALRVDAEKLRRRLADIYYDKGQAEEEREQIEAVIALQRARDPEGLGWTKEGGRLAGIYRDLKDHKAAAAAARAVLAALPTDPNGPHSPLRLNMTRSLANSLLALEDYKGVLAATDEIASKTGANGRMLRLNLGGALLDRARALRNLGQYEAAEAQYGRVLAMDRSDVQDAGLDDAQIYRLIGLNCLHSGDDKGAQAAADQSLAANAARFGAASLDQAQQLLVLAEDVNDFPRPFELTDNPERAETLFRRSIEIMDKLPKLPESDYLAALDGLAAALGHQAKLVDAIKVHERRIKLMSARHGKASHEALRAQSDYSDFLSTIGNDEAALDVQRSMFETALQTYGPENETTVAIGVNSLSLFVEEGPRLDHGRYVYETLFGDGRNNDIDLREAARMVMAQLEASIGDPDKAAVLIKEIDVKTLFKSATDMPFDIVEMLLGQIDRRKGIYGQHSSYMGQIAQKCEGVRPRDSECETLLADYGEDLYLAGDFAAALPYVTGGYELAEREQASLARRGARSRRSTGNRISAEQFDRYGLFADTIWETRGIDRDAPDAGAGAAIDPRIFRAVQRITNSEAASAMAVAQTRIAAGTGELAGLIQHLQAMADTLNAEESEVVDARMSDVLNLVGNARGAKRDDAAKDRRGPRKSAEQLARLQADYRALDDKIRLLYPEYAALLSPAPVALADVQKALGPGQALLVAAQGEDHLHMLLVTRDSSAWQRSTVKLAEIDRLVTELLCHVDVDKCPAPMIKKLFGSRSGADITPFDVAAAHQLYEQSVGLLAKDLAGIDTLYVVAEGQMAQLPLGMLATEGNWQEGADAGWLIDRFAFIRLPSVSALLLPKKDGQLPWTREFEGYGDPLLDGPPRRDPAVYTPKRGTDGLQLADVRFLKQLAPLKGSRRELVDMADIFPAGATAIHLGAQATEAGVKGNAGLGGSRIVSFATHGLLPTQVAGIEEPGLVLTPPGKPSLIDDGMLTASEVTQLRLSADMVILSACNTASAEHDRAGDSMSSLSRAFLFAGAGSLLASHWRVSDDSTVALMTEMLRLRRADPTLTRAKALQQAMRTVRIGRRADGSAIEGWQDYWAHPSAWAAFSLIANGDE